MHAKKFGTADWPSQKPRSTRRGRLFQSTACYFHLCQQSTDCLVWNGGGQILLPSLCWACFMPHVSYPLAYYHSGVLSESRSRGLSEHIISSFLQRNGGIEHHRPACFLVGFDSLISALKWNTYFRYSPVTKKYQEFIYRTTYVWVDLQIFKDADLVMLYPRFLQPCGRRFCLKVV